MRVERFHLIATPGVGRLREVELDAGLVVIVGPNASGKSSLARAVRGTLWPTDADGGVIATSTWQVAGGSATAMLSAGRTTWTPALPNVVPEGASHLARLGLRSLLSGSEPGDRDVAKKLARELAGGFDLEAARREFARPTRLSRNSTIAKDLRAARGEVRRAESVTDVLASDEAGLVALQDRGRESEAAQQRAAAGAILVELVDALAASHALDEVTFSDGLDSLTGAEAAGIRGDTERAEERADALRRIDADLSDLSATVERLRFSGEPPRAEEVEAWRTRLDALVAHETRSRSLADECASLSAQRAEAARRVRSESADAAVGPVGDAVLDGLARDLETSRAATATLAARREAASVWEGWRTSPGDDLPAVRRTISSLRAWLRAKDATESAGGAPRPAWIAPLLIVLGVVIAALVLVVDVPWLVGGLLVSGVGIGLLVARRGEDEPRQGVRGVHRADVEKGALAPEAWDAASVEAHLVALETLVARMELAERAAERSSEARDAVKGAEVEADAARDALMQRAAAAGVDTSFVELSAVEQAQALQRLAAADAALTAHTAERESVVRHVADVLGECGAWLDGIGVSAPSDVAAAHAAVRSVAERRTELERAEEAFVRRTAARGREAEAEIADAAKLSAAWADAGVSEGDLRALDERLEEWALWKAHRDAVKEKATLVADARRRLAEFPTLELPGEATPETISREAAGELLSRARQQASEFGDVREEIGDIQGRLRDARSGDVLENAIASARAAERAVAAERERAVEDAVARLVLDDCRGAQEAVHSPPALERMRALFTRFTHGHWRIDLDDAGAFVAHEHAANVARPLDALSDATRAQLLLAARVAMLESLESPAERLPLFLDETLSNCDPVRFREIARAVFELVDDGRQIVYLTADPSEAAQWREAATSAGRASPHFVDLGALPEDGASWGEDVAAAPSAPDPVPAPERADRATYGRTLGVAAPDGFEPVSAWHLFFVAGESLDALAECLRRRVVTVGHWTAQRAENAIPPSVGADVARRFDARAALLAAVLTGWRVGRGRPVTWDDVHASGAVSATFEDRVRPLVAEHARDPVGLIAAVDDLKGFRAASTDKLREHLLAEGVLDDADQLSATDVVQRALAAAPDAVAELGPETSGAFADWIVSLL